MARRYRYRYGTEPLGPNLWVAPFPVALNVSPRHYLCPLPRTDEDFAILTEVFFGVPLSLEDLWVSGDSGRAKIAERYDSFATVDGHFTSYCIHGYDRLSWLWQTVTGPMGCSRSLTSTGIKIVSHRQRKRLTSWIKSRRGDGLSGPTKPFVRLAHKHGVGESILGRVDRRSGDALRDGRVDAASTVQHL